MITESMLAAGKQPLERNERSVLRTTIIQERLWELCKDKGLNPEKLSNLIGISKSTLASYETNDYKRINHSNLITLSDFYEVSLIICSAGRKL